MDILAAGRLYIQDIGHEPCILAEGIEASEGERFFLIFLRFLGEILVIWRNIWLLDPFSSYTFLAACDVLCCRTSI